MRQTVPYFEQRYGCEMSDGELVGDGCDKAELSGDPVYESYQDSKETSQTVNRFMMIGGISMASVGVATLVGVAVTRPSSAFNVSVTPRAGGAQFGATIQF